MKQSDNTTKEQIKSIQLQIEAANKQAVIDWNTNLENVERQLYPLLWKKD